MNDFEKVWLVRRETDLESKMQTEIPINYDIEYPALLRKDHELCKRPTNDSHDVQRLLDRIMELEQQRDATLKLAQSWLNALYSLPSDSPGKPYTGTAYRKCANEIRAIFEPKEGK